MTQTNKYIVTDIELEGIIAPFQMFGTTNDGKDVYVRERCHNLRVEIDGELVYHNQNIPDFQGYQHLKQLTEHIITWPTKTGPAYEDRRHLVLQAVPLASLKPHK